jgi:ABC-type dipeptide/oligopeptide/nickel transport system permease subunit
MMWAEVARVVRVDRVSVKEMQHVTAARALGLVIFELYSIIYYLILFR